MSEVKFRSNVTVELVDHMGDEQSIVRAARVSTLGANAELEEAKGLIKFLMREGHGTPFEAPTLTFRLEVPVFVSRQVVKHRISSINEESGRYKELEPVFYIPSVDRPVKQVGKTGAYTFEGDEDMWVEAHSQIKMLSNRAWTVYESLLATGVAKEVARMVLPVNIYSTMYVTMNLRGWLNFVKLRTSYFGSHPQHEVELVGREVMHELFRQFPSVMDQFMKEQKIV